jgi:hypothetical protein
VRPRQPASAAARFLGRVFGDGPDAPVPDDGSDRTLAAL